MIPTAQQHSILAAVSNGITKNNSFNIWFNHKFFLLQITRNRYLQNILVMLAVPCRWRPAHRGRYPHTRSPTPHGSFVSTFCQNKFSGSIQLFGFSCDYSNQHFHLQTSLKNINLAFWVWGHQSDQRFVFQFVLGNYKL
jgi:hypothetical protein